MKKLFRRLIRPLLELQLRRLIARHKLKVVAVAGSVGKTSTKSAIATVLARKYRVRVHEGNYNDTLSVPVAAFGLEMPGSITSIGAWLALLWRMERIIWGRPAVEVLVLELGTDHPGEIPHFMRYLTPEIGVLTAVAPEHMEFFKTLDAVAAEECALARGARRLLVGGDDVALEYRHKYLAEKPFSTYGLGQENDYRFEVLETLDITGERGLIRHGNDVLLQRVELPLLGSPAAKAATAAVAVGDMLGLSPDELRAGLTALKPVPGRLQLLSGKDGVLLIDDTYNSAPVAVLSALKLLHRATGRRIAVLGQMNELGDYSQEAHETVGSAAADGIDLLVTVGGDAERWLGPAAVEAGLPRDRWMHFSSPFEAGEWLAGRTETGDTILFKGSQNKVYTEEVLKYLLADPTDASRLVRQSEGWLRKKHEQFKVQ